RRLNGFHSAGKPDAADKLALRDLEGRLVSSVHRRFNRRGLAGVQKYGRPDKNQQGGRHPNGSCENKLPSQWISPLSDESMARGVGGDGRARLIRPLERVPGSERRAFFVDRISDGRSPLQNSGRLVTRNYK